MGPAEDPAQVQTSAIAGQFERVSARAALASTWALDPRLGCRRGFALGWLVTVDAAYGHGQADVLVSRMGRADYLPRISWCAIARGRRRTVPDDDALSPEVFDEVFAWISEAPQTNELFDRMLGPFPRAWSHSRSSHARASIASSPSCGSRQAITSSTCAAAVAGSVCGSRACRGGACLGWVFCPARAP